MGEGGWVHPLQQEMTQLWLWGGRGVGGRKRSEEEEEGTPSNQAPSSALSSHNQGEVRGSE